MFRYSRITILDRKGLEATMCECYQVVKDEYDRLLGQVMTSILLYWPRIELTTICAILPVKVL